MITQSVIYFINSYYEIQEKKLKIIGIKSHLWETLYIRLSFLFKYCLLVEIISANMGARQVQDYYNIRFFLCIREPWL